MHPGLSCEVPPITGQVALIVGAVMPYFLTATIFSRPKEPSVSSTTCSYGEVGLREKTDLKFDRLPDSVEIRYRARLWDTTCLISFHSNSFQWLDIYVTSNRNKKKQNKTKSFQYQNFPTPTPVLMKKNIELYLRTRRAGSSPCPQRAYSPVLSRSSLKPSA